MIVPASYNLAAIIGGSFDAAVIMYQANGSTPFDLTLYTATFVVGALSVNLTVGSDGKIPLALTAAQTATFSPGAVHYYVKLAATGKTFFPLQGDLIFANP